MINEAFFALMEGVSAAEDIDRAMREGCNYPMGPLAVADLIGEFTVEVAFPSNPQHNTCPYLCNSVSSSDCKLNPTYSISRAQTDAYLHLLVYCGLNPIAAINKCVGWCRSGQMLGHHAGLEQWPL